MSFLPPGQPGTGQPQPPVPPQNPYAQQQGPYGQPPSPGPYGQAQQPGQFPGDGFQGGFPPPPKKGFPAWAWWVIGGGVLVIVAVIVVIAMVVSSASSGAESSGKSGDTSTSSDASSDDASKDAKDTDKKKDDDTDDEADKGGAKKPSSGLVTLQDSLELGDGMALTANLSGDWKNSSDSASLDMWASADLGCSLVLTTLSSASGDDDAAATQSTIDRYVRALGKLYKDASGADTDGRATVVTEDSTEVEFQVVKLAVSTSGVDVTTFIGARASVKDSTSLTFTLTCPGATSDPDAVYDDVIASLLIARES